MNQCMRITFIIDGDHRKLHTFVQEQAKKYALEGMVQPLSDTRVRVVACGLKESMEDFLDALHYGIAHGFMDALEVEPFLKDRDYRGVFRVIG